jgi:hypothetical protein
VTVVTAGGGRSDTVLTESNGGFDEHAILPSVLEPAVLPSSPSQRATHDQSTPEFAALP